MARPTKAEQERIRIESLRSEGKGPDGEPIEDAKILSETKNTAKPVAKGDFSIAELTEELENATLGGNRTEEPKQERTLENSDLLDGNPDDPDYIKTTGHNRFNDPMITNESDANKAAAAPQTSQPGQTAQHTATEFAEPVILGGAPQSAHPEDSKPKPPVNPDFDKLSPTEQRKQVEMFADAILTSYQQYLPIIPTMICQYNMGKMEVLDKDGIIRLSMTIQRDEDGVGLTVREEFNNFNAEVEEIFVVTDEMKLELRDPLIAVLMEKGIAPTPMMTLCIGVARHVLMILIGMFKMLAKKSQHLETFKDFRKQEIEKERTSHIQKQHERVVPVAEVKNVPVSEEKVVSMEEAINSTVSVVTVKQTSPKQSNQKGITIEDVVPED